MKKSTIWIIATIMGLSFLGLLFLQLSYIEQMAKMKKEQFDESVNRDERDDALSGERCQGYRTSRL